MLKQRKSKKIVLGLTGSFGSGKSTVALMFKSFGDKVIDADKIAHRIIRRGERTYKKITGFFGAGILKKNKEIDRLKLGALVFRNRALLKQLNAAVHPEVIRIIRNEIGRVKDGIVVVDAPLLLEAGLEKSADKLIVVKARQSECIKRIRGKAPLSGNEILRRIRCQMPLRRKIRMADFIIDNNGSIRKSRKQVNEIRRMLWKN